MYWIIHEEQLWKNLTNQAKKDIFSLYILKSTKNIKKQFIAFIFLAIQSNLMKKIVRIEYWVHRQTK